MSKFSVERLKRVCKQMLGVFQEVDKMDASDIADPYERSDYVELLGLVRETETKLVQMGKNACEIEENTQ